MSVLASLLNRFREKRWAKWLAFSLFSWLVFSLSLYLTFPSEAVRDRVVKAAEQQGLKLRMESVGLSFPPGLSLRETYLILREPDPKAEKAAVAIHLPKATLRPSLLGLVTGKPSLSFDARIWGGTLSGKAGKSDEGASIQARLRGADLSQSMLGALGLQFEGTIEELRLEAAGSQLKDLEGELVLHGEGLVLNGGEVNHFSLPKVTLGTLEGKLTLGEGRAEIEEFSANGADITAMVEGSIRFADRLGLSTLQTKLRFKPSEDWWEQNEMLRAGAAMALRKDSDGFHNIQLYGQLSKPRFRMN